MKTIFRLILSNDGKWYDVDKRDCERNICVDGFLKFFPECKGYDEILVDVAVGDKPQDGNKWVWFVYIPGAYYLMKGEDILSVKPELLWYCFGKCSTSHTPMNIYVSIVKKRKYKKGGGSGYQYD